MFNYCWLSWLSYIIVSHLLGFYTDQKRGETKYNIIRARSIKRKSVKAELLSLIITQGQVNALGIFEGLFLETVLLKTAGVITRIFIDRFNRPRTFLKAYQ